MNKFKKGDTLVIKEAANKYNIGKVGTVIDITDGDYYTLDCLPNYAFKEDCLDFVNGDGKEPPYDIKEAVEAMYHHTKKSNVAYYWMVGTVVSAYALSGLGRIAAVMAFASLLFSLGQNMWQGVMLERFIRRLDADRKIRFDSYPDHISNGGWALYMVKVLLAVAAVLAMICSIIHNIVIHL